MSIYQEPYLIQIAEDYIKENNLEPDFETQEDKQSFIDSLIQFYVESEMYLYDQG